MATALSSLHQTFTPGSNNTALSIFNINKKGTLFGTGPAQTNYPTISSTGPIPFRQNRSYLHHVIIDPTNAFVLSVDMGGVRIKPHGVGPRHGFFRSNKAGEIFLFFIGELSQNIYSYRVTYNDFGLMWEKVFQAPAIGFHKSVAAGKASPAEIILTPDQRFPIISNRHVSFLHNTTANRNTDYQPTLCDTFTTWTINEDGWFPRHFSSNECGDLLTVGHRNTTNVVVWKRDMANGLIVDEK